MNNATPEEAIADYVIAKHSQLDSFLRFDAGTFIESQNGHDVSINDSCLIPFSPGIKLSDLVKVDLWDMFYMEAPKRRTEFEKKYMTLKRASRPSLHAMESTSRPF
jgi:hypothetical protein